MTRDPYTGQQLRCLRTLPRHEPISGPFIGVPQHRGDFWVGVVAIVAAILIITSEVLGWPMP